MWRYDDIAIVVAIAEKASFIAASEMLAIPSSTLSRRVSELESQLGLRLFERNTRSLKLTQKESELVKSCSQHIQSLQKTMHTLTTDADAMSGVLRVSAPLTLGNDLMSPCLTDFIKRYPQIKLELDLSNDYTALLEQNIDIALRVGPLKDSELIAQKLFSTEMVLCASPDFIRQYAINTDAIHTLEQAPFLTYMKTTTPLYSQNIDTKKRHTINVIEKFTSNHTQTLKTACIEGIGLDWLTYHK